MNPEPSHEKTVLNRLLKLSAFILLFILSLLYCRSQVVFTVNRIFVHGQYELSEEEIIKASGIHQGADMFHLDLGKGIEQLIDVPYIYNAYISRQFPDVVNIHVIERQPVALIRLKEDYALDAFATMLPSPKHYPLDSMPVIGGVDRELPFDMGKPTFHPDIRHAINFVNYVARFNNELRSYCSHITWSGDKGWIIQKEDDYPPVYLGKNELEKRFDILDAFIAKMHRDSIDMRDYKYVSLRFNGQVIVRD
jgi:hypothetical protein